MIHDNGFIFECGGWGTLEIALIGSCITLVFLGVYNLGSPSNIVSLYSSRLLQSLIFSWLLVWIREQLAQIIHIFSPSVFLNIQNAITDTYNIREDFSLLDKSTLISNILVRLEIESNTLENTRSNEGKYIYIYIYLS